jgi:hypothetical protein
MLMNSDLSQDRSLLMKFCALLKVDLGKLDEYTKKVLKSGFYVMLINHDIGKLNYTLEVYGEILLELFIRDGGEKNIESAFRSSLNCIRYYYDKEEVTSWGESQHETLPTTKASRI